MTGFEERWAVTALASFAPEGPADGGPQADEVLPAVTPRPGEVDYLQTLRTMLGGANLVGRLGIRLAIWLIAFSPFWSLHRFRTLGGLLPPERSTLIHRLLEHPWFAVRELCLLLKVVTCMALLAPGPVRARTAFDPPSDDPPTPHPDHQEVAR